MPPILPRRVLLPLAAASLLARPARAQARPLVVISFSILGDMVRQLGGEDLPLHVLADVIQPFPTFSEAFLHVLLELTARARRPEAVAS